MWYSSACHPQPSPSTKLPRLMSSMVSAILAIDPGLWNEGVVWLDSLPGNVVLPEVRMSSVDSGPFAPEVFVPEAARRLGRTELP